MALSKGKFDSRQGLLIVILIGMMTVASFYLFRHAFAFRYVQLDLLLAAIIFSFFFLLILLIGLHEFQAVDIYENYITVKWLWRFFPRKIAKEDILLFSVTLKNNHNYIIVRTVKDDIVLQEQFCSNHTELIDQLNRWKIKRKNNILFSRQSALKNKGMGVIIMVLSAFLLGFTLKAVIVPDESIDGNKMITLSGHLSMPASINIPSGKNSDRYIQLYLTEFPGINFQIESAGYNLVHLNQIKKYQKGTVAELTISRREYAIKITKTEEPGYWEKHFDWATIDAYGVTLNNDQLYTIDEYNESKQALGGGSKKWGVLTIGLSAFMFLFGVRLYQQQKAYHNRNLELLNELHTPSSAISKA